MYQVEIIHPKTGEVIEIRSFNSRYEAEMYGQQYQRLVEILNN